MIAVRTPTLALVGNPNTGKTTLFNALAGMNQRVGNYPGVTVETKKGKFQHHGQTFELIDLPGTYSLAARSPDEMLAVNVIWGTGSGSPRSVVGPSAPDGVIIIIDASNLERNLYLATQVFELGIPVVIALNMVDVAQRQGIKIDVPRLSANLGVPVIPIQANKGKGLDQLRDMLARSVSEAPCRPDTPCRCPSFPAAFETEVRRLSARLDGDEPAFLVRRLLVDVGGYLETHLVAKHGPGLAADLKAARQRLAEAGCPVPAVEARIRYAWIRQVTVNCLTRPAQRPVTWTDRIDRVLTDKLIGTLIFLGIMFVVFWALFEGARPLMNWISAGKDVIAGLIKDHMAAGPLRSLIVGGIVEGVGSVLAFLPQIIMLFAFIAVLEDCGYMSRAAFLMDRLMARAGLNGKSFIPLLSSVACAVPGIMAARVIENRRDRLATILVAPLMSCSARLPVYVLLISAFLSPRYPGWVCGLTLFALYCIGLVVAPLMAFVLKSTLLRGETPAFVMEMPLYKVPSLRLVLRRALEAGWMFIARAGTLILASMIVIWALLYFPSTDAQGQSYDRALAGLDGKLAELKAAIDANPPAEERQAVEEQAKTWSDERNQLESEWRQQSLLGRVGKFIEPGVRPLGWDWKIGMAVLASFPAREVMVGTLGIIYGEGKVDSDEIREVGIGGSSGLGRRIQNEPTFTVPVAMSVLVFFALCCQCASTLAVIHRESQSWAWPAFTFGYMTILAYVGALLVYQIGAAVLPG